MPYLMNKFNKNTQYTVQHVTEILPAMRQVFPRYMTCPITSRYRTATNEPIRSLIQMHSWYIVPASYCILFNFLFRYTLTERKSTYILP